MNLTIFDIDNWREIGATLMRNKTRTFLTGFGIFWGVAMLAMLTGGARGGEDMLKRNFAGFATNTAGMIASPTTMPYRGYRKGRQWQLDMTDVALLRESFPEIDALVPTFQAGNVSVRHGRNSFSAQLKGAVPEYTRIVLPRIVEGRFVNDADMREERKVVVLGRKAAAQLFPDGSSPVGKIVELGGTAYSVVGVADDVGEIHLNGPLSESVVVPASTFRRVYGYGDRVDFLMVTGRSGIDLAELLPKMQSVVYRRHGIHPDDSGAMWTVNIAQQFEMVDKLFLGVDMLAWFIGLATLLAGVIGIGNIMWVIVKERTQEIGIRRAIGARPRDIIVQVLSEGTLLTLVAGLGGICFAAVVLGVAQKLTNGSDAVSVARFQMSLSAAFSILGIFLLLGIAAGIVPSLKAMRIKPVEAINSK